MSQIREEIQVDGIALKDLIEMTRDLIVRVHEGASDYFNSSTVVCVADHRKGGKSQDTHNWSVDLDIMDTFVLGGITQAPLALVSETDQGKTYIAERCLSAMFGPSGRQWRRIEVSKGMSQDDMLDIDLKKLTETKLSAAISGCKWLAFPARLFDEINRAPAKLNNMLLNLVDGSGLNFRGQLYVPVGAPYIVNGQEKRYSFTVTTANETKEDGSYDGTFVQDNALIRRMVLTLNLDDLKPSARDIVQLTENRRPKSSACDFEPATENIIRIYESLSTLIPYSSLGRLFLQYLSGRDTCIRTRSGHIRPEIQAGLCSKCHLYKSNDLCGRVGGLSPGLLLWCKEIATGIAAIRAAKTLQRVLEDCDKSHLREAQKYLKSQQKGQKLFRAFQKKYLNELTVTGEDVIAAYSLVAPGHVFVDKAWLSGQSDYEESQSYAFADVGRRSFENMCRIMMTHEQLFNTLSKNGELTDANQEELQALITTEDVAFLSIITAIRENPIPIDLGVNREPRPALQRS